MNKLIVSGNSQSKADGTEKIHNLPRKYLQIEKMKLRPIDEEEMSSNPNIALDENISSNSDASRITNLKKLPHNVGVANEVKLVHDNSLELSTEERRHVVGDNKMPSKAEADVPVVHIYGKAAIGRYLWRHILEGELGVDSAVPGTLLGRKVIQGIRFIYREGETSLPSSSPYYTKYNYLSA